MVIIIEAYYYIIIDEDMYIFNIYIWDCNMFAKKEKYHHLKGDRELILHTNQQTSAFIIIYI